jgi:hypothetical protein
VFARFHKKSLPNKLYVNIGLLEPPIVVGSECVQHKNDHQYSDVIGWLSNGLSGEKAIAMVIPPFPPESS